jgi:hypothetical protein
LPISLVRDRVDSSALIGLVRIADAMPSGAISARK